MLSYLSRSFGFLFSAFQSPEVRKIIITNTYGNPLPADPHISIKSKSKTIVIGDVHGCLEELRELLIECSYEKETTDVVFVGDLVNKGCF